MEKPPCDTVCFHAEQCAEKYLKGFLTYHQLEFPKTHSIETLVGLCKQIIPSIEEELAQGMAGDGCKIIDGTASTILGREAAMDLLRDLAEGRSRVSHHLSAYEEAGKGTGKTEEPLPDICHRRQRISC